MSLKRVGLWSKSIAQELQKKPWISNNIKSVRYGQNLPQQRAQDHQTVKGHHSQHSKESSYIPHCTEEASCVFNFPAFSSAYLCARGFLSSRLVYMLYNRLSVDESEWEKSPGTIIAAPEIGYRCHWTSFCCIFLVGCSFHWYIVAFFISFNFYYE